MTDRMEQRRQEAVRAASDHRHREVFGVGRPPDPPPRRAELAPVPGPWTARVLPVAHRGDCDRALPETTTWVSPVTGDLLLIVTRCAGCGAQAQERAPGRP